MNPIGTFQVAVAAIIEKDGKILITKRSPTRDHAPNEWEAGITGRIGQNETMEEALTREANEELGIQIRIITPFRTFHFYRGKEKIEHLGVNFWCQFQKGEIHLDLNEQVEYKWVDPDTALSYITDRDVISAVKDFITFKKRYLQ